MVELSYTPLQLRSMLVAFERVVEITRLRSREAGGGVETAVADIAARAYVAGARAFIESLETGALGPIAAGLNPLPPLSGPGSPPEPPNPA